MFRNVPHFKTNCDNKNTSETIAESWQFRDYLIYNLGHNILELYNVLKQTQLTTSKTKRDI